MSYMHATTTQAIITTHVKLNCLLFFDADENEG